MNVGDPVTSHFYFILEPAGHKIGVTTTALAVCAKTSSHHFTHQWWNYTF